jgi:hypothetical protein
METNTSPTTLWNTEGQASCIRYLFFREHVLYAKNNLQTCLLNHLMKLILQDWFVN